MNTKTVWLGVLVLSTWFFFKSYELVDVYSQKIHSQERINIQAEQVKSKFNGLQTVKDSWEKTFPSTNEINDLISLYRVMDLKQVGFQAEANNLYDSGRYLFNYEGESHGLVNACLANDINGMVVLAQSVRGALAGLAAMEANSILSFDGFMIDQDKGRVRLTFPQLCVLLRGS